MHRGTRRAAARQPYHITVDVALDLVVAGCHTQHGENWLYPPVVAMLKAIAAGAASANRPSVSVHSFELWTGAAPPPTGQQLPEDRLVAGELGVAIGGCYLALTGFRSPGSRGAGGIQMVGTAAVLRACGFQYWDLGMHLAYKSKLGAAELVRPRFIANLKAVRDQQLELSTAVAGRELGLQPVGSVGALSAMPLVEHCRGWAGQARAQPSPLADGRRAARRRRRQERRAAGQHGLQSANSVEETINTEDLPSADVNDAAEARAAAATAVSAGSGHPGLAPMDTDIGIEASDQPPPGATGLRQWIGGLVAAAAGRAFPRLVEVTPLRSEVRWARSSGRRRRHRNGPAAGVWLESGAALEIAAALRQLGVPRKERRPARVAEALCAELDGGTGCGVIDRVVAERGGFLALKIDEQGYVLPWAVALASGADIAVAAAGGGGLGQVEGEVVVVDYCGPNLSKQLHRPPSVHQFSNPAALSSAPKSAACCTVLLASHSLSALGAAGHLRSTVIGDGLANLFEASGATVLRRNHAGDWGAPAGLVVAGLRHEHPELFHSGQPTADAVAGAVGGAAGLAAVYRRAVAKQAVEPGGEFDCVARRLTVSLQTGDEAARQCWGAACAMSLADLSQVLIGLRVGGSAAVTGDGPGLVLAPESDYAAAVPRLLEDLRIAGVASLNALKRKELKAGMKSALMVK